MRKKIDIAALLFVLVIGFFGVTNAAVIGDYVHSLTYSPPPLVTELTQNSGFSDEGKRLFLRFEPQIKSRAELTDACGSERIGCVEGHTIYILAWNDQASRNQAITTSAHEMLHVPYARFDEQTLNYLRPLLDAELSKPAAAPVVSKLGTYSDQDYYAEAHSFIGTELADVSSKLETHYARYFSDRGVVLKAFTNSN